MPNLLYKILSEADWEESQSKEILILPPEDANFIHFSTADQLERILGKYWSQGQKYVIVTVDTEKLPGEMRYEANPGRENKYYHLYNGAIPFSAIVNSKGME